MDLRAALRLLNLPPRDYVLRRVLPAAAAGLVAGGAAWALLRGQGGSVAILLPVLALLAPPLWALGQPFAATARMRREIEDAIPFFVTHFGVLSAANLPRTEIFRVLSRKREYKALAQQLARIHGLVTDWKMSLPEAARFVAAQTPSQIFGDFLERMAHAMETGQPLDAFLESEQEVVMKEYAALYETAIYQVESWKDLYASVVMSGAFFVIFATIMPILTGSNPQRLLLGALGFVFVLETLLFFALRARLPSDRLWIDAAAPGRERLRRLVLVVAPACVVLAAALYALTPIPVAFCLAAGATPLAFVGWTGTRAEEEVKRREDNYGAFVRSVGASAGARGGSLRDVLQQVSGHDFGPLTAVIRNLHARLTWRLDDAAAWKRFSLESGSQLMDAFTDMFVEGVGAGGKAEEIGEIISKNVVRILNLRRGRYSTAATFRGLLIGLTGGMAFVMYLGIGILESLGALFGASAAATEYATMVPIALDFEVNAPLLGALLTALLFIHALLAALMLKQVDGGHPAAGLLSFVAMAWIVAGLSLAGGLILPLALPGG